MGLLRDSFNLAAANTQKVYRELDGRTTLIGTLTRSGGVLTFDPSGGADISPSATYAAALAEENPNQKVQLKWFGALHPVAAGTDARALAKDITGLDIEPFPGTFTFKPRISPETMKSAIDGDDIGALRTVLQNNVYVDARFAEGDTALTIAAEKQMTNFVKLLIEYKANVNLQSNDGITALMHSASIGDVKTVRVLLDAGADISLRDEEGLTARDHAVQGEMSDFLNGPYPAEAAARIRQKADDELAAKVVEATVLQRDVTTMTPLSFKKK